MWEPYSALPQHRHHRVQGLSETFWTQKSWSLPWFPENKVWTVVSFMIWTRMFPYSVQMLILVEGTTEHCLVLRTRARKKKKQCPESKRTWKRLEMFTKSPVLFETETTFLMMSVPCFYFFVCLWILGFVFPDDGPTRRRKGLTIARLDLAVFGLYVSPRDFILLRLQKKDGLH